ncbi:MAG: hypothetical protein AB7G28_25905 [Pirellulales bacterium]
MAAVIHSAPAHVGSPSDSSPGLQLGSRSRLAVLALIVAVAAALRVAAARGELWLDEVWSIYLVQELVHSPGDVIFRLRYDNNHMLTSWVAYAIGPVGAPWQYRLPAVTAGIATVLLAGWAQQRSGRAAVVAAMTLAGSSYLLIHYSSEARGYAALTAAMLLAYGALRQADATGRVGWEALVAVSCMLGFLAHVLFLPMYLAIQVWTWLPDGKPMDRDGWRKYSMAALFRTLLPGFFFAWLYWVNYSRMKINGGDEQPHLQVLMETMSLACGGAFGPPWNYAAAATTAVCTAASLWYVFRKSPRQACFFGAVIVAMPAVLLAVAPREDIYTRYFLGSVLFLYLLWSEALSALWQRSSGGQTAYFALLGLFVAANLIHVVLLISLGRSHYHEAIDWIERETAGPQVRLSGDHGFRHQMMLYQLSTTAQLDKPVTFDPLKPATVGRADWLLTHNLDPGFAPPAEIRFDGGRNFRLVRHYPFAGLSGWQLNVYRRVGKRPAPPQ